VGNIKPFYQIISVHKSKIVKEDNISKCCPRIKFVFRSVRSQELNLIEIDGNDGYKGRWQLKILHSKMSKKW
jgi:hypothetical protein